MMMSAVVFLSLLLFEPLLPLLLELLLLELVLPGMLLVVWLSGESSAGLELIDREGVQDGSGAGDSQEYRARRC
jgi:hypothetical protein